MKKIKFYTADGLFMARSSATANCLFFESQKDHALFFKLVDRYLGNIIEVVHFSIIPTAWILIFRTKSEEEIRKHYLTQRAKSKKAKLECTHEDIGRIISEHFRIMNSLLVKYSNKRSGRHGTKVHSVFEKFIFEDEQSFHVELDKMEALLEFNEQWLSDYHAQFARYDAEMEMEHMPEFKTSKSLYALKIRRFKEFKTWVNIKIQNYVLSKLISCTFELYFPNLHPT